MFCIKLDVFGCDSVFENINQENIENETVECDGNGAHFLRVFLLRARAWTKNEGRSKLRNGLWLGTVAQQIDLCWLPTRLATS